MLPQKLPPRFDEAPRRATAGFFMVPNSVAENLSLVAPAEQNMLLICFRRGPGCTVTDQTWTKWTGLHPRMKDNAIRGLREKGLTVSGRGNSATFSVELPQWSSWVRTRPRHERARTAGRSKSVTAKTGMQVHPDCRERCQRLCQTDVIPFPATNLEKPVSQEERRAEDQTPAKADRSLTSVPGASTRPPESPPKKFPQSLEAVRTYFPHVEPEFIDKLRARCDRKVKHYTDAQLAQAINKAMKRTQTSEGLFLDTVPGRLAVILSTRSDLTEPQKRVLKMARMVMEDPENYTPDAVEQALEILRKYGG